jgi:hypothetical protein
MAGTLKEWSVALEVATQRETVSSDRLFDLIELLEPHHADAASLSPDGTRIGINFR